MPPVVADIDNDETLNAETALPPRVVPRLALLPTVPPVFGCSAVLVVTAAHSCALWQ